MKLPRLKEVRELHGWSQAKLAEESDVSRDSISNYETGQREAWPATAKKLADTLGVEIADLVARAEEPALAGKAEAPKEPGPTADPYEWARENSARLHGMSDEEWTTHIRELGSVGEIKQEFQELVDEAKGLHAAHGGDRWLRPENQGQRIARTRKLREIRTDRLADLASAAAKKRDEALTRRVMEALLEEAHS